MNRYKDTGKQSDQHYWENITEIVTIPHPFGIMINRTVIFFKGEKLTDHRPDNSPLWNQELRKSGETEEEARKQAEGRGLLF